MKGRIKMEGWLRGAFKFTVTYDTVTRCHPTNVAGLENSAAEEWVLLWCKTFHS